ncbi:delta and Notch-like EGF repeat containing weary isoform 2-T2 [Cochliomyia hominivorax]
MNILTKFLKIMLRLWSLWWAVSLISLQLTTATLVAQQTDAATTAAPPPPSPTTTITASVTQTQPAFESTSANPQTKVLRLTATTTSASTIQLRLHDAATIETTTEKAELEATTVDVKADKAKVLTTSKEFSTKIEDEITKTKSTSFTTISASISTLASSNAPATITNQAKNTKIAVSEKDEKYLGRIKEEDRITAKQYKDNDDKLEEEDEGEMKETDFKQVTETVQEKQPEQQQQQQPPEPTQITTDVSWQTETDMHKQSQGNARNAENYIKITQTTTAINTPTDTATVIHDISTVTATATTTTILPDILNNEQKNSDAAIPTEQYTSDQDRQKEIPRDSVTFNTPTTLNNEMSDINLNLPHNTDATDDFKPIIRDANEKLLKERTIFSSTSDVNHEEWKQNLMPNELEYGENKPLPSKSYEHNINWSPYLHPATPVSDFTGKLLQEQDGVITEIEQKFRLKEFETNDNSDKTTKSTSLPTEKSPLELTQTTTFSKDSNPTSSFSVNHEIININKNPILNRAPLGFIERRVKKSFDFPMHRVASDAQHMQQHFDFANTKFNSNNNEQTKSPPADTQLESSSSVNRPQPEFSTTKFYNSKELYNEMLQHKTKQQQPSVQQHININEKDLQELNNRAPSLALNSFAVLHSPKIAKLEEIHEPKEQQQQQKSLAIKKVTVKSTKHKETSSSSTTTTTEKSSTATTSTLKDTATEMPLADLVKTKKFQKELNRAKLLIKSMMTPSQNTNASSATTTTPTTQKAITSTNPTSINNSNNEINELKAQTTTTLLPETKLNSQTTSSATASATASLLSSTYSGADTSTTTRPQSTSSSTTYSSPSTAPQIPSYWLPSLSATSTNPPKTSLRPIVRPRILSRLQEKINSLECELQNLPQDSHLWRGNETHELLLPIMTPENCKTDKDCTAMMVSWEGEAEIQSGDILIVEINDALLTPKDINLTTSAHNTQVYQVTRSGHEHCDVTEGILLDITPLIVDGRKLVTLYDKDLTEGVNLLIVVSELWGSQCVRLKVTTKTENCGENADCSGKGICFSNYDMEEYECQCCSGFAGPHCEEIDACTPSPCTNNGICVDLSQGHEGNSYQCLCPYGYTGKNCQYELDPCNPADCMNGGSCVGNSTHFRCDCTPGYTGPLCQHSLNECESSPCIHGICVDQEDGFRCFCQPGFAGELCNFEYNECESNPCQNGGECIDHIGSYECHCTKGYTGNRCQIKVDFCANKPCPEGRRCIDHGNDYSCECLGGRNGPDCNEMQRTQCNVNPCTHGGTCWSSGDSFYCACRPGYTGTMCEDEFVVETVVSSSEFMVDDTSARNFNDKSFGSSVVLKSPIELHNAYTAAIVLALVIFFVALYLTICHCKVNQTYRKFSTRTYGFLPILGFRLRTKQATSKISRHWLSGKGLGIGNAMRGVGATTSTSATSALHATATTAPSGSQRNSLGHLPTAKASSGKQHNTHVGQLNERPFQRHLAMNLENDMYYTVDFSENSQHSPLIQ